MFVINYKIENKKVDFKKYKNLRELYLINCDFIPDSNDFKVLKQLEILEIVDDFNVSYLDTTLNRKSNGDKVFLFPVDSREIKCLRKVTFESANIVYVPDRFFEVNTLDSIFYYSTYLFNSISLIAKRNFLISGPGWEGYMALMDSYYNNESYIGYKGDTIIRRIKNEDNIVTYYLQSCDDYVCVFTEYRKNGLLDGNFQIKEDRCLEERIFKNGLEEGVWRLYSIDDDKFLFKKKLLFKMKFNHGQMIDFKNYDKPKKEKRKKVKVKDWGEM